MENQTCKSSKKLVWFGSSLYCISPAGQGQCGNLVFFLCWLPGTTTERLAVQHRGCERVQAGEKIKIHIMTPLEPFIPSQFRALLSSSALSLTRHHHRWENFTSQQPPWSVCFLNHYDDVREEICRKDEMASDVGGDWSAVELR